MNRKQRRALRKRNQASLSGWALSDKGKPYVMRTRDGRPFLDSAAIFPIFTETAPGEPIVLGTGFYVTRFGHFLTARHVLMELHEKKQPGFMFHMLDDDESAIRRDVVGFSYHQSADIAVGRLEHPPGHVLNCVPTFTLDCPKVGDEIVTVAYDKKTRFEDHTFSIGPQYISGTFEEAHPNGRDGVVMPYPCYRCSMTISGGSSGGPIFDHCGRVFAINVSSYDGTDISYAARIAESLGLSAHGMKYSRDEEPVDRTLLQLAHSGHIIFDPKVPQDTVI